MVRTMDICFLLSNVYLIVSSGKSATGNSLLHSRSAFYSKQGASSVTKNCLARDTQFVDNNGRQRKLVVVDTPGFFDSNESITNDMVEKTIASEIFNLTAPGVHAFLIVLRPDRFTPEEKKTVEFIKTIFGQGAAKYCMVIFSHQDQLDEGQTLDEYIQTSQALREFVSQCGNRKFAINNRLNGEQLEKKTKQLIQLIDEMVQNNNGTYYTNEQYQQIEKQRKAEQERRKKEESDRKKAEEERIAAKVREHGNLIELCSENIILGS